MLLPPEGWPELPPEGVSLCIGTVGFVYVTDTMLEYIAGLSLPFLALLMAHFFIQTPFLNENCL